VVARWRAAEGSPIPVPPEPEESADDRLAAAARGHELFKGAAGCISCHVDYGRAPKLSYDLWGNVIQPRNLTLGLYRGGRSPQDLYCRLYGGIKSCGMTAQVALLQPSGAASPDEAKAAGERKIWDPGPVRPGGRRPPPAGRVAGPARGQAGLRTVRPVRPVARADGGRKSRPGGGASLARYVGCFGWSPVPRAPSPAPQIGREPMRKLILAVTLTALLVPAGSGCRLFATTTCPGATGASPAPVGMPPPPR
jgi:hypothetical protein